MSFPTTGVQHVSFATHIKDFSEDKKHLCFRHYYIFKTLYNTLSLPSSFIITAFFVHKTAVIKQGTRNISHIPKGPHNVLWPL